MNVDLSQIIWTVICFGLFALVVDRLLFKPVLKVMDGRRERLENARALKAEAERREEERREAELLAAAEAEKREKERRAAALEAERQAMEAELDSLSHEIEAARAGSAEELERFSAELWEGLGSSMDALVGAFTEKLVRDGMHRWNTYTRSSTSFCSRR